MADKKVKLRVTMTATYEYEADPKNYREAYEGDGGEGLPDADEMAEIDQANYEDDPAMVLDNAEITITVEPV